MALSAEFSAYLEDLFAEFGPVRVRGMFGGAGIFHNDVMIGLVSQGTVYLRTDPEFATALQAEGSVPFRYAGRGKTIDMPYWRLPERALDEPDQIAAWARRSYDAALRAKRVRKSGNRKQARSG